MNPSLVFGQETSLSSNSTIPRKKPASEGGFESQLRSEAAVRPVAEKDLCQIFRDSEAETLEHSEEINAALPVVFGLANQQSSEDRKHDRSIQMSSVTWLEGKSLDQLIGNSDYRVSPSENLPDQTNFFVAPEGNALEVPFQAVSKSGLPAHLTSVTVQSGEPFLSGSENFEFGMILGMKAYGEETKTDFRTSDRPATMGENIQIALVSNLQDSVDTKMLNSLQDLIYAEMDTGKLRSPAAESLQRSPIWSRSSSLRSFRIKLQPEHLGTLSLVLRSSNEGMGISIQADSLEGAAKLALVGEELVRSLESVGISVKQLTIEPLYTSAEITFSRKEASENSFLGSHAHFESGEGNMEQRMSGGGSKRSQEPKDTSVPKVEDIQDGTYI